MSWFLRRRLRVLGLLQFRDEMRFLPGYFENLRPLVDGVIALDDGSTDGSTEFVAARPEVLELVRLPPRPPGSDWDEATNRRLLIETAWRHEPDWLVAVDADERLEVGFRRRAERQIAAGLCDGISAYNIQVRELWDLPSQMRVDGIWGRKKSPRLFQARRDHQFHELGLHGYWAPLDSRLPHGDFAQADLYLYHLRMIDRADREARRARYERLDPDCRFQAIGYSYLTDETGLELERVPWWRRYRPRE